MSVLCALLISRLGAPSTRQPILGLGTQLDEKDADYRANAAMLVTPPSMFLYAALAPTSRTRPTQTLRPRPHRLALPNLRQDIADLDYTTSSSASAGRASEEPFYLDTCNTCPLHTCSTFPLSPSPPLPSAQHASRSSIDRDHRLLLHLLCNAPVARQHSTKPANLSILRACLHTHTKGISKLCASFGEIGRDQGRIASPVQASPWRL